MEHLCKICEEKFVRFKDIGVAPCGHAFHSECLLKSIRTDPKCPICKKCATEESLVLRLRLKEPSVKSPTPEVTALRVRPTPKALLASH